MDMNKDKDFFVAENDKAGREVVDEIIRKGFNPMDMLFYIDQGSLKIKHEGTFPGGQKELDKAVSESMQKHGPAECRFNFRGISEYIEMKKMEASFNENNIQVLDKSEDGMSMNLKHAGSFKQLSDAVINTVSELFDQT